MTAHMAKFLEFDGAATLPPVYQWHCFQDGCGKKGCGKKCILACDCSLQKWQVLPPDSFAKTKSESKEIDE